MHMFAEYDVTYSNGAFRAGNSYEAPYTPTRLQIHYALNRVLTTISAEDRKRWMAFKKSDAFEISDPSGDPGDTNLTFIVPSGGDQYDRLLAALPRFEEAISEQLGAPVDTAYRSIKARPLVCMKCGDELDWMRYTMHRGDECFCDSHAREEPDFENPNPRECVWTHMMKITT